MSELSERPDRFGCIAVATVLVLGLLVVLAIVVFLLGSSDFQNTLRDFAQGQEDQADSGPGGGDIPPVSNRYFGGGTAQAVVTGGFSVSPNIQMDTHASYVQDGLSWLSFIDITNPGAGEVLVVFGEPANSVTVASGATVAIGRDTDCNFDIHVTSALLSGSISCGSVDVLVEGKESGTTSIQLHFSADTDPSAVPGEDGDGTGDDGT